MIGKIKVITNNPLAKENLPKNFELEFVNGDVEKVFIIVRDYIHKGHKLLTHPLMSSIKPNETPYRTVMLSKEKLDTMDMESLTIIEESMASLNKFMKMFKCPNWTEKIKEDFMFIDYDLINNLINK